MELETISTPIGMRQRSSGVTVVVRSDTRDAAGELVTEAYSTTFVRGAQGESRTTATMHPATRFDEELREREPDADVEQTFDSDQTYRYAEASGDPMQIHLDDEFAKSVGLPGIIIHGLCTMAFTSVAVLESHSPPTIPTRLKPPRRPVRLDRPSRSRRSRRGSGNRRVGRTGAQRYAYETTSEGETTVIKDGLRGDRR